MWTKCDAAGVAAQAKAREWWDSMRHGSEHRWQPDAERSLTMVLRVLGVRRGTVGGDVSGNGARRGSTLEHHHGAAQPLGKVLSTAAHRSDRAMRGGGISRTAHIGG
jgi:hypothetical protein